MTRTQTDNQEDLYRERYNKARAKLDAGMTQEETEELLRRLSVLGRS